MDDVSRLAAEVKDAGFGELQDVAVALKVAHAAAMAFEVLNRPFGGGSRFSDVGMARTALAIYSPTFREKTSENPPNMRNTRKNLTSAEANQSCLLVRAIGGSLLLNCWCHVRVATRSRRGAS